MKRFLQSFVFAVAALGFVYVASGHVSASEISVSIDNTVIFEGQTPVTACGRILVPVGDVLEGLGFNVDWNEPAQTLMLTSANHIIIITIGSETFTTNGKEFALDVPAQIIGGRAYLPIRAPLESAGFLVDWDSETNTVIITSDPFKRITPVTIATGAASSFAILADGSLWAWGRNDMGQLGDGTRTTKRFDQRLNDWTVLINNDRDTPVKIMDDVVAITAGGHHTAAIRRDGSLWTWGSNSYGQLGDGTVISRLAPVKVLDDVIAVSAGFSHTLAIRGDGSLWAWGHNNLGQLGLADAVTGLGARNPHPARVMDGVTAISAGVQTSMAITYDGGLWAWGRNDMSQLGNGIILCSITQWDIPTPNPVRIMDGVAFVSTSQTRSLAITTDGGLYIWGFNDVYHFGMPSDFHFCMPPELHRRIATPTHVMDGVQYAIQGGFHLTNTYIIMDNGSLVMTGGIPLGERSADNFDYSLMSNPQEIMLDVAAVSTYRFHTLAVTNDGSLWVWGNNEHGQLGDGTNANSVSPVRILGNIMLP